MSQAVRNRRNRRDTAVRFTEPVCGAMLTGTEYETGNLMLEIKPAVPTSASLAGRFADGLLPDMEAER